MALTDNTQALVQTYGSDLEAVTALVSGSIDFWMTDPVAG